MFEFPTSQTPGELILEFDNLLRVWDLGFRV